jgi:hyperosmotically inducible protein
MEREIMKSWKKIGWSTICGISLFIAGCASGPDHKSTGEVIDDSAIHTKVKTALVSDPVVSSRSIDIDVERGTVILKGVVNGEVEKQKAEEIARGVSGVRAVQNDLVVRK